MSRRDLFPYHSDTWEVWKVWNIENVSARSGWGTISIPFPRPTDLFVTLGYTVTPLNQWISVALMAAFIVTRSRSMDKPSISCAKWAVAVEAVEAVEVDTCGYLELRV